MSCYHPYLGVPEYKSEKGKWCFIPRGHYDPDIARTWNAVYGPVDPRIPKPIMIPCGKCIGCRLDYSRAWADRMMLELDNTGKACFITLTYDNDHLPIQIDEETGVFLHGSLYKRDLQLFFKRWRKAIGTKLRYYAVGEYGTNTERPHYHAIVFGVCPDDFPDLKYLGQNELSQPHYKSDWFAEKIWQNGFCVIADVNWQTCAYVSRYVQKKVFAGALPFIDWFDLEPEFSVMSRNPGIAGYYLDDHPDVFDFSSIWKSGKEIRIPKYFLTKLKQQAESDPIAKIKYDDIMNSRKQFADDALLLKMQKTDISYVEQLELEENEKLLKTSVLKRVL